MEQGVCIDCGAFRGKGIEKEVEIEDGKAPASETLLHKFKLSKGECYITFIG